MGGSPDGVRHGDFDACCIVGVILSVPMGVDRCLDKQRDQLRINVEQEQLVRPEQLVAKPIQHVQSKRVKIKIENGGNVVRRSCGHRRSTGAGLESRLDPRECKADLHQQRRGF